MCWMLNFLKNWKISDLSKASEITGQGFNPGRPVLRLCSQLTPTLSPLAQEELRAQCSQVSSPLWLRSCRPLPTGTR